MLNLLGEYDCKLDAKGRLMFPAALKRQLEDVLHEGFVINRDLFEKCLVLYPRGEWNTVSRQLDGLNRFIKKNVSFIRRFNNGATPVTLDGTGRLLVPMALAAYADFEKEVKLMGNGDRIEIWSKLHYEQMLNEDIDMGALSEEVMGDHGRQDE
ncbi:MAG: division/cell wall cluster transcriptional repressor MraZ [Flavobacteriales bacterium]|nr:division/cell wall cluster transcriptional repressor MraZ [Flavobacteriales bacterium]